MVGSSLKEQAEADMAADQVMDLRNGFVRLCYGSNYAENKVVYSGQIKLRLDILIYIPF